MRLCRRRPTGRAPGGKASGGPSLRVPGHVRRARAGTVPDRTIHRPMGRVVPHFLSKGWTGRCVYRTVKGFPLLPGSQVGPWIRREEDPDGHVKRVGDEQECGESDLLAGLDALHAGQRQAGVVPELFLRHALVPPPFLDASPVHASAFVDPVGQRFRCRHSTNAVLRMIISPQQF